MISLKINPVICLMGPTSIGKTALAVGLVKRLPLEIISVDSAMVYKGMDIGTAKPSPEILAIAPHRLISIRDPAEPYSAAQFKQDAEREIAAIHANNKIPLLVGGTMLYFRALQQGIAAMPSANQSIREKLIEESEKIGWEALHQRLLKIDPVSAARIHPNDSQRIQRALEVHMLSGENLTAWHDKQYNKQNTNTLLPYKMYSIAILPSDRAILHKNIEMRFMQMLEEGFLKEAESLYQRKDLSENTPAMRSVGYRQAWEYFDGKYDYNTMREKAIIATRQLAKRQLTWLRHWENAIYFQNKDIDLINQLEKYILNLINT